MDEKFISIAEATVGAEINAGITRARKKEPKPAGFDGSCACGDEIPHARVALGYYRCLACQTLKEREARRY